MSVLTSVVLQVRRQIKPPSKRYVDGKAGPAEARDAKSIKRLETPWQTFSASASRTIRPCTGLDEKMANILKSNAAQPEFAASSSGSAGWPEAMRKEWGEDEGNSAAARHRDEVVGWLPPHPESDR